MFLKALTIIRSDGEVIRHIPFHEGLNLIVDETPSTSGKETGNNVGKTTVLKLVHFCLGGDPKSIYSDHEDKRNEYKLVKDFLIDNKILIQLVLKDDLSDQDSREVVIERNFLARKNKVQRVDGKNKGEDEFEEALTDILFPGQYGNKPTFKQIIAHNIRYKDLSLNNTTKHLDKYTRDDEYETLYLFLLGCDFEFGETKQELRSQINIEESFKKRLEAEQTKSGYETALALLKVDINELELKKSQLNLNSDFEKDLNRLNTVKYNVNLTASEIGRLELRKSLIVEAQEEIESNGSDIDINQLNEIYRQATSITEGISKKFHELHDFHNKMLKLKAQFIAKDLPKLTDELVAKDRQLNVLLAEESKLSEGITQSDSFESLERLIEELNAKHQTKGEYDGALRQLNTVESKLKSLNSKLSIIDTALFSDEFGLIVKEQVNKFNLFFSSISQDLYGEKYALKPEVKKVKGRRLYEFTAFNTNFSSGKKQGEISCFDIAYTLFADDENIPCMHFLLNDKKELMHDNQLVRVARMANEKGIQFVASILQDKLPDELNKDSYIAVKLSPEDKLFRIE